jgi:pSer/pThr/pTyr-binding forkhead associated (FHA) protein
MLTMATPGQQSVCFSCGQPLPRSVAPVVAEAAPQYPLTAGMPAPPTPPPNPYSAYAGGAANGAVATGATILGAAGQFAIRGGVEVRVGRDPAQCPITLGEPRVSGVHATLKFEGGQLLVRDESSNNGTFVGGVRIAAASWMPVPHGAPLRFGPVEFSVRVE